MPENPHGHRVMARNQSLCQVSSTCTDFERGSRQTLASYDAPSVTELAPNGIKTKNP